MKNVITYLKTLWSWGANSQSSDVSHDCRLTVGSPSGMTAKLQVNSFMRFAVVLTLIFTLGVGNVWGDTTVLFQETFGVAKDATYAYSSYDKYSAEASYFTTGTAQTNYTGAGTVGKSTYAAANLSSGYTGASGFSGIYHQGTQNTTATIIQISNISISDFTDLHLSFGALGGGTSHTVDAYYQIDDGDKTQIIKSGTITNANWTLQGADIPTTGKNLTIWIEHTPTKGWTIRIDDILVTGTAAPSCTPLGTINGSI